MKIYEPDRESKHFLYRRDHRYKHPYGYNVHIAEADASGIFHTEFSG